MLLSFFLCSSTILSLRSVGDSFGIFSGGPRFVNLDPNLLMVARHGGSMNASIRSFDELVSRAIFVSWVLRVRSFAEPFPSWRATGGGRAGNSRPFLQLGSRR